MKNFAVMFILFILSTAFCTCATTGILKNNAKTEKYKAAVLTNLTVDEFRSFASNPALLATFTDEQRNYGMLVYDTEGTLPDGISFNPKKGMVSFDFDTYLFLMRWEYEDNQLVSSIYGAKDLGKYDLALNPEKGVCGAKTALFVKQSGAIALYSCEVKGVGLLKKAKWTKEGLKK